MSKLTLSVDPSVVARAKRFVKQEGLSISEIVETYLALISAPPGKQADPPILRSLRGVLKRGSVEDYRSHLLKKYR